MEENPAPWPGLLCSLESPPLGEAEGVCPFPLWEQPDDAQCWGAAVRPSPAGAETLAPHVLVYP